MVILPWGDDGAVSSKPSLRFGLRIITRRLQQQQQQRRQRQLPRFAISIAALAPEKDETATATLPTTALEGNALLTSLAMAFENSKLPPAGCDGSGKTRFQAVLATWLPLARWRRSRPGGGYCIDKMKNYAN